MYEKLYEQIVRCAEEKAWPICKVEREANVGNGVIGHMKSGRGITVNTLVKIAKALDVSVDYLLGITDEQ